MRAFVCGADSGVFVVRKVYDLFGIFSAWYIWVRGGELTVKRGAPGFYRYMDYCKAIVYAADCDGFEYRVIYVYKSIR